MKIPTPFVFSQLILISSKNPRHHCNFFILKRFLRQHFLTICQPSAFNPLTFPFTKIPCCWRKRNRIQFFHPFLFARCNCSTRPDSIWIHQCRAISMLSTERQVQQEVLFIIPDYNLLYYIVLIRCIVHDDVLSYGSENKFILFYFYLRHYHYRFSIKLRRMTGALKEKLKMAPCRLKIGD